MGKYRGKLQAVVLFVDISGFTSMTQKLMENGKEGAEILTKIINDVFTPSIEIIYRYGGFVSTFGGDAFYAIFPSVKSAKTFYKKFQNAVVSAEKILKVFLETGYQRTKFGNFRLEVKIGAAWGEVQWGIIKNQYQNSYFFKGEAIEIGSQGEKYCNKGEIVIDRTLKEKIGSSFKSFEKKSGFYLIEPGDRESPDTDEYDQAEFTDLEIQKVFFPENIIRQKVKGEFRDVVSCFISFAEKGKYLANISKVISLANHYGGYFNRVSFGDKGGFLLILFGAPVTKENLLIRACDFVLGVIAIKGFKAKIGMTYGRAFAGFTGSSFRAEYTAQGRHINLAARLMTYADTGQILIDESILRKVSNKYIVSDKGKLRFKGFNRLVQVYCLGEKKKRERYKVEMVGRKKELKLLNDYLGNIEKGKFGGIVYIEGEPGIGKTVLLQELRERVKDRYTWMYLPCDEILKNSFNPIKSFLKDYFNQSELKSNKENFSSFEKKYRDLIDQAEKGKKELIRIKSILGSLVNLFWEGSLFEQLNGKGRYENILYGMKQLIIAESSYRPVIIELEDGHLIDPDTEKWLDIMTRNVDDVPFIILTTCRFNNDGSNFTLKTGRNSEKRITLGYLDKEGIDSLSKIILQANDIPTDTLDYLSRQSEGNPFYLEQILKYLSENNLIDEDFRLLNETFEIPSDINAIIISRIDRLRDELKVMLQTASVLGREFVVNVLRKMLKFDDFENLLREGETESIYFPLNELIYIFKHALIRESIYQMQLKERLRNLHKLAAETIEEMNIDSLEQHYAELANHYEKAQIRNKTLEYLEKAGDLSKEKFENRKALDFYNKLLFYLRKKEQSEDSIKIKKKYIDISLKVADIMQLIGEWEKTEKLYRELLKSSEKFEDEIYLAKIKIMFAEHLDRISDYQPALKYALDAVKVFEKYQAKQDYARASGILGHIYWSMGNFPKALSKYNIQLSISDKLNDRKQYADAKGNMAVINIIQGNFDEGKECLDEKLRISIELNDKINQARAYGNTGNLYLSLKKYEKSLEYFKMQYEIAKELGDRKEQHYSLGNMGLAYHYLKQPDKAMEYYEQVLVITEEIGDVKGLGAVLSNIGGIYYLKKDYDKAIFYYKKRLETSRKIKDKIGLSQAYMNIGSVYGILGQNYKCLLNFKKSLSIAREIGMLEGVIFSLGNIAQFYKNIRKYKQSLETYNEVIEILEKNNLKSHLPEYYLEITELLIEMDKKEDAILMLNKGMKSAVENDDQEMIRKFKNWRR